MKSPTTLGLVVAALSTLVFVNQAAQGAQPTNPHIRDCETHATDTAEVPSVAYDPANITESSHDSQNSADKSHVVMEPDRYACRQLVVFLSGSKGKPERHSWVLKAAAWAGYRTIGLSYDTEDDTPKPNPSEVCYDLGLDASSGIDCQAEIRKDHILGGNRLADLANTYLPGGINDLDYGADGIAQEDSIVGELVALLESLADTDSWYAQFLSPNREAGNPQPEDIVWDRIILGGFSQGSGHGSLMATLWGMHGFVGFSGPFDSDLSSVTSAGYEIEGLASWLAEGETPGERRFYIHHLYENGGAWSDSPALPNNMDALNLPQTRAFRPETLSWDALVALDAHRFGTDRTPYRQGAYHGSVAVDDCQFMITNNSGFELTDTFDVHVHMFQRAGE